MLNMPIITPPRVPLVDPNTGLISRAWYLFFVSLFNTALTADDLKKAPDVSSLLASYDAALQALAQEVQTQPTQESALDQIAELQKQIQALETQTRNELGTMSAQNADNVKITGGSISGLVPPLPVASGGTGQSTFTDGQLLIGNSTGNTLTPAVLTAGANITITNGPGSITIAAAGVSGASGSFTTADIPPQTVTVVNGIITSIV